MQRKMSLVISVLAVPAVLAASIALADKLSDFAAAAAQKGCEAIPYHDKREDCQDAQKAKNTACRDFSCDSDAFKKTIEKLQTKRKNLDDAKQRNNLEVVPNLVAAIEDLEDDLKQEKALADERLKRGSNCLSARKEVQSIFASATSKVQGESDPELEAHKRTLVAHFKQVAGEHVVPMQEVNRAIQKCKDVQSTSW